LELTSLLTTPKDTGPPLLDQTALLTRGGVPGLGGGVTNVLVVTTTVGVLNGVHRNTSHLRPGVSFPLELVELVTLLKDGLIDPTATLDNTDDLPGVLRDFFLPTGGKLDHGLLTILGLSNDKATGTGLPLEGTPVSELIFDHGDDLTFGALADGEDVTDLELGGLTAVDELAGVHTLDLDHQLLVQFVLVLVPEDDLLQGLTSTGVVDDLLDETFDEPVPLTVVEGPELLSTLPQLGEGPKDPTLVGTFPLASDNSAHFSFLKLNRI